MYKYKGDWYREDDDGNEVQVEIPEQEWMICDECRGEGMSLCDGMRGHAYSMEEFHEEFDEEERHGYFTGRYDTRCDSCNGTGKVKGINWEKLEARDPELVKEINEYYEQEAYDASVYRAEMGYGRY